MKLLFVLIFFALLFVLIVLFGSGWVRLPGKMRKTWQVEDPSELLLRESRKKEGKRLVFIFVCVALVCGLLTVFLMPPMAAPDEPVHFANIYALSHGLSPDENLYVNLPSEFGQFISDSCHGKDNPQSELRYAYRDMYGSFQDDVRDEGEYAVLSDVVSLGYLAPAAMVDLGVVVGRLMGSTMIDSPYDQMMLGRLGNLLFYILMVYWAIRRAPHYKRTIMLIALMPMTLFLCSSLSYDGMLIPTVLYYIALVLDLSTDTDERLKNTDIAKVFLCVILLTGIKIAYAPLILLLLAVPKKKYGSTGRMILCIAGVAVSAFIGYLPSFLVSLKETGLAEPNEMVVAQRAWFMTHLTEMPRVFLSTFLLKWSFYINSFWGEFGWLDTLFPFPLVIAGMLVLLCMSILEGCTCSLWKGKQWKNLLPMGGMLVSFFGIFITFYLSFTPLSYITNTIGGLYIEGVQGRYLIPLYLPMVIGFSNPLWSRSKRMAGEQAEWRMDLVTVAWGTCCAFLTWVMILIRYWI